MPPYVEKKAPAQYVDSATPTVETPLSSVNVIDVETAQEMANNAASRAAAEAANIAADRVAKAANEAATRTLSGFKDSNDYGELSLDREMKRLFYQKMTKPSFGEVLAEQIDNKLAGEIVGKLIPGLFGAQSQAQPSAPPSVGSKASNFILEVLNTQFAYGAGQTLGNSVPEIIKTVGKERIEQFIDAYQQRLNPEEQMILEQQRMMEEEQRQQQMQMQQQQFEQMQQQQFAEQQFAEQQFAEQQRIQQEQRIAEEQRKRKGSKQDLNRELIQQYESGNITAGKEGIATRGEGGGSGGFFNENSGIQELQPDFQSSNFSIVAGGIFGANLNENEFILSLNSDDPVSQQQYMAFRGIAGVPFDIVKRMMIKEQNSFREGLPSGQPTDIIDVPSTPVITGDSWSEHDINKPHVSEPAIEPSEDSEVRVMKKDEFYKEIGLKTEEQKKPEQKIVTPLVEQTPIIEKPMPEQKPEQKTTNDIPNTDVIVNAIERIGQSFEKGLVALTGRIELIENEFVSIKSNKEDQKQNVEKIGKSIEDNISALTQRMKLIETDLTFMKSVQIEKTQPIQHIQPVNVQPIQPAQAQSAPVMITEVEPIIDKEPGQSTFETSVLDKSSLNPENYDLINAEKSPITTEEPLNTETFNENLTDESISLPDHKIIEDSQIPTDISDAIVDEEQQEQKEEQQEQKEEQQEQKDVVDKEGQEQGMTSAEGEIQTESDKSNSDIQTTESNEYEPTLEYGLEDEKLNKIFRQKFKIKKTRDYR